MGGPLDVQETFKEGVVEVGGRWRWGEVEEFRYCRWCCGGVGGDGVDMIERIMEGRGRGGLRVRVGGKDKRVVERVRRGLGDRVKFVRGERTGDGWLITVYADHEKEGR